MDDRIKITDSTARAIASAELQVLLATKKIEGCQDLEAQAWAEYEREKTPENFRTALFMAARVEVASSVADLARLQLEAVRPYRDLDHYDKFRDLQAEEEPTE